MSAGAMLLKICLAVADRLCSLDMAMLNMIACMTSAGMSSKVTVRVPEGHACKGIGYA